jgi:hypothetical protein
LNSSPSSASRRSFTYQYQELTLLLAKQTYGFPPEKLTKLLLAGLLEQQPRLDQWHAELDPAFGTSPAEAIKGFLDAECQALGVTRKDLERVRVGP